MLPLIAELRTEARASDRRVAARRTLKLEVESSNAFGSTRALIHNLSQTGLMIETSAWLSIGDIIDVELPQAGAVAARIVRAGGTLFGAEFLTPVSRAAVSAALLLAPVEQAERSVVQPYEPARTGWGEERADESAAVEWDFRGETTVAIVALAILSLIVALFIYALIALPFSTMAN